LCHDSPAWRGALNEVGKRRQAESEEVMPRAFAVSVGLPLMMGFVGALLAQTVAIPTLVDAQEARIRAERFTVVGADGVDRIDLATGPGLNVAVQVRDSAGARRAGFNTGGLLAGNDPDGAGFNVWLADGTTPVIRLGTGRGPTGDGPLRNILFLADQEGRIRIRLVVDESGAPAMEMLDANGTVTWSAR
jgi:hypothetical protein